jgi:hypothetical protein
MLVAREEVTLAGKPVSDQGDTGRIEYVFRAREKIGHALAGSTALASIGPRRLCSGRLGH